MFSVPAESIMDFKRDKNSPAETGQLRKRNKMRPRVRLGNGERFARACRTLARGPDAITLGAASGFRTLSDRYARGGQWWTARRCEQGVLAQQYKILRPWPVVKPVTA